MKILVVEDDINKLRNVVATLVEVDGVSLNDIAQVSDAVRAKRYLSDHQVDVIVLDLHLPDRIDLAPQPTGGIDFIRSIMSRPSFTVPTHVVALSGNSDALASAAGEAGEIWGIIHYDVTTNVWRDQLKTRIRYAQAAYRSMVRRPKAPRPCDIAIITALDEELAAIRRLPLEWQEHRLEGDGTIYFESKLEQDGKVAHLTAAAAGRMGMAATAVLASKIIDAYRPRFMCMAGLTGGIRGRVKLGDVLIADPSWDWGSGKYEVVDGKPRFSADPQQLRISDDIRPQLMQASTDEDLLGRIRSSFPGTRPSHPLECHVQAVASGASVLGDEAVVEEIKLQNRKLHGVEMEIYGLMMAADTCANPRPIAFSAKSVSDYADTTKDDDYRPYANYVSANFIFEFAKRYILRQE